MISVIKELCQAIGIENFGELDKFQKEEKQEDESLVDCLMRYYSELGGSKFKIIAWKNWENWVAEWKIKTI